MHSLLLELRPVALLETSLGELLKQLVAATGARARIDGSLVLNSCSRLPPEIHTTLYRIAQESLNNVVRYARAAHVVVSLQDADGGVALCVQDDGRGFDPTQVPPSHLGLEIMQQRAQAAGMSMRVKSQVDCGTEVTVVWSGDSVSEA